MIDPALARVAPPRPALHRALPLADARTRLTGRRVLVLGVHTDVGAAIAVAMARAGADVALSYSADFHDRGRMVASIVRDVGPTAAEIQGDLADDDVARQVPGIAAAALGGLDVLVHTWSASGPDDAAPTGAVFATNVIAMVQVTRATLRLLGAGACIVNTVTNGQHERTSDRIDVTAMIAAAEGWTAGLATELIDRGIRVNAIAAGPLPVVPDDIPYDAPPSRALDGLTRTAVLLASPGAPFPAGATVRPDHAAAPW